MSRREESPEGRLLEAMVRDSGDFQAKSAAQQRSINEAEARATWQVKPEHVFQSGSGLGHSGDLARRRSYSRFSTAGGLRGARRQRGSSMGEGKAVR